MNDNRGVLLTILWIARAAITGTLIGIILGLLTAIFATVSKADATNDTVVAILEYSAAHEIDPLLVTAVIRVESKFDPKAVGSSGEIGLMQLHPKWFPKVSFNIRQNIAMGVQHLAWSRKHCPNQEGHTWVTCYNNGVNRSPKHPTQHPYYKAVTSEYTKLQAQARRP